MAFDFSHLKAKSADTHAWLKNEFIGIRTGQATPALLDGIKIDSYGALMPLNQVASISIEDARTLRVQPWDLSQVKTIEKAVTDSDLGLGVGSDESGVRVFFPELTSDRRVQLQKLVGQKLEEARVTLRHERDKTWNDIQKKQKDGEMSEDEKFSAKEEMEKLVQAGNAALEELAAHKEKEMEA